MSASGPAPQVKSDDKESKSLAKPVSDARFNEVTRWESLTRKATRGRGFCKQEPQNAPASQCGMIWIRKKRHKGRRGGRETGLQVYGEAGEQVYGESGKAGEQVYGLTGGREQCPRSRSPAFPDSPPPCKPASP